MCNVTSFSSLQRLDNSSNQSFGIRKAINKKEIETKIYESSLLAACLQGICWFWFLSSSPATKKYAVCLKNNNNVNVSKNNHLPGSVTLGQKINLKKFIILVFESSSISGVLSNACCMWCNHLSAAWCVTGNGRCRPIRAGCPAKYQEKPRFNFQTAELLGNSKKQFHPPPRSVQKIYSQLEIPTI